MIKTHFYTLPKSTNLTPIILKEYVQLFWSEVYLPLQSSNNSMHLMVICKVLFTESTMGYKTLADMRRVNFTDDKLFAEYLVERVGILSDSYNVNPITQIEFTYIERKGLATDDRALLQPAVYSVNSHGFNNYQLPLSMTPSDYGTILSTEVQNDHTRYIVSNRSQVFVIDVSLDNNTNNVRIEGVADITWSDTKISDNSFKRTIGKSTLYISEGNIIVKAKVLSAKPFRKLKKDNALVISNYMTIDIETVNIDKTLKPYLICGYDGKNFINSYATDHSEIAITEMFRSFFKQIFNLKKIKYVYAHNLSGFDGIFLLSQLIKFDTANVEPVLFNGKLMAIKYKTKDRLVVFKDSYLLLPMSLRQLCKSFAVSYAKTYFPFLLSDIDYVGEFPHFQFWSGITKSVYDSIRDTFKLQSRFSSSKDWSFKLESVKYCQIDCKCLFDVLEKFNELIFIEFKVNIHGSLTLPALAMRIYKIHYMPKDTIYQIQGKVEQDIRESYTGGAVDVYLPHNGVHKDFWSTERHRLYYYDVNSLYPWVMSSLPMPIGKPVAFEGNIRMVDSEAFGFFYCNIKSPDFLLHPLLQRKIKTKDGLRTIAGLGSWTGWVSSVEMDNAIHQGYQFEIIKGYKFDTAVIFKEYVEKMYSIRIKYPKGDPMNLIAKLLMNSLYGKFGMKSESTVVEIYDLLIKSK